MATAIVSTAAERYGLHAVSLALAAIAMALYAALVLETGIRLVRFWAEVADDWRAPRRVFGFLTFVAGSTVLGERLDEAGWAPVGVALVVVGMFSWLVLGYGAALSVIVSRQKAASIRSLDGGWMLWVVATEAVAAAAAMLSIHHRSLLGVMPAVAAAAWAAGCVLYLVLISILFARLLLIDVEPDDLDPNYWVMMGATAISTLAGARLLELPRVQPIAVLVPSVTGLAFMLWAFGSWLVPLLVGLGVWRHGVRRIRLAYTPALWTMVFPLGMYSAASAELGAAAHLSFLHPVGAVAATVALAAWAVVAVASTVAAVRGMTRLVMPRA